MLNFRLFLSIICAIILSPSNGLCWGNIELDKNSYQEKGNYAIIIDKGYSPEQAIKLLADSSNLNFEMPPFFKRSRLQYWMSINLENKEGYTNMYYIHAAMSELYLDHKKVEFCYNTPCDFKGDSLELKKLFCGILTLTPGKHVLLVKISHYRITSDSRPVISAVSAFEIKKSNENIFSIGFIFIVIGISSVIGLLSISVFIRIKGKAFLFYAIFCFTIVYNSTIVLSNEFGVIGFEFYYIPWIYTKGFIAHLFFASYTMFAIYFIDAKNKYPNYYKVARGYVMLCVVLLIPEVITLTKGDLALNYNIYFCTRLFLDVFAVALIIWIRIIGNGIYVKLLFIGSSMLIIGELVSNFYNGYIATIMANTGVLLDVLVFTAGMGYRIRDYYRDQLKLKSEVFKKNDEITLLNMEKTQLNLSVLQGQMNPHFVFNSLNSINRYILKDQSNYASDYLTKFAKLLRFILDNTTILEVTLTDEINYLKLYLDLESIRFNGKFNFKINIANNINTDNYYFPPLILQPIAENSIKHGFVKKDKNFNIILNIYFEDPYLFVELNDNGIGIAEAAKIKQKSMFQYESKGLAIVKERLSKYQVFKDKIIEYSIHDVYNQDGSVGGTKTIIKIEN